MADLRAAIALGNALQAVFDEKDEWGTWADLYTALVASGLHVVTDAEKQARDARVLDLEADLAQAKAGRDTAHNLYCLVVGGRMDTCTHVAHERENVLHQADPYDHSEDCACQACWPRGT